MCATRCQNPTRKPLIADGSHHQASYWRGNASGSSPAPGFLQNQHPRGWTRHCTPRSTRLRSICPNGDGYEKLFSTVLWSINCNSHFCSRKLPINASGGRLARRVVRYRVLGVLDNAPIVFHAHALVNGHDRSRAISPIGEAD